MEGHDMVVLHIIRPNHKLRYVAQSFATKLNKIIFIYYNFPLLSFVLC